MTVARFVRAVRIGGSTYSKEPFPKQVAELRESGFDYAELDLTWITLDSARLREEATELAKRLPLETAHLPPSRFTHADLARCVGFIDALAPLGTRVFNAHFLEARASPRVAPDAKTSWFADFVRAATDRGVVVTLENGETVEGELERQPQTIYLTGGMSRAPYVQRAVTALFPGAEAVLGNASLGVVSGLAIAASVGSVSRTKAEPLPDVPTEQVGY